MVRGLIAPALCLTLAEPGLAQNLPSVTTPPVAPDYAIEGPGDAPDGTDRVTDFAVSNSVFILRHEIGHLLINEFELPVLGREEDAADILASLWLLEDDTDASRTVLADAVGGWYLSGGGMTKASYKASDFYDVHALDIQRSFNILCLGVGKDRMAFFKVAENMGMRAPRRATCRFDFRTAEKGWTKLLEPHKRAEGAPRQTVTVFYDEARPAQAAIAAAMQKARVLEQAAEYLSETYVLPRPLTFHAKACYDENAYFNAQTGTILFCYEVASYFGTLLDKQVPRDQAMRATPGAAQAIMPVTAQGAPSR